MQNFKTEFEIEELIKGADRARLKKALIKLLGNNTRISKINSEPFLGQVDLKGKSHEVDIMVDFEPIAYLQSEASEQQLEAVKELLQILLAAKARYYMAVSLHQDVVRADYLEMEEKNQSLQVSKEKYKELSEKLEERVQEQIEIIEVSQRKLYETEKMASIGHLAAGVAHEINNPISFINSNFSSITRYIKKIEKFCNVTKQQFSTDMQNKWVELKLDKVLDNLPIILEESQLGCSRIANIVQDLRVFSNIDNAEWSHENINDIIKNVCSVNEFQISDDIVIKFSLSPQLPDFYCQRNYMSQVIHNLLSNSVDAINDLKSTGSIVIETCLMNDNKDIMISITDTGSGIPDQIHGQVFTPFFTTKDVNAGTGLGLTVCHDIIQRHKGKIDFVTSSDKTTFTIILPAEANQHG